MLTSILAGISIGIACILFLTAPNPIIGAILFGIGLLNIRLRKHKLVTNFGKFADPLADKMLVFSAMAILMLESRDLPVTGLTMPMWAFVIMIIREFMVSGIRMLVASKGVVIPAGKLGKFKTFTTMIAICVLFFAGAHDIVAYSGQILMYVACLFTVISGAEYFWQSRKVIFESI